MLCCKNSLFFPLRNSLIFIYPFVLLCLWMILITLAATPLEASRGTGGWEGEFDPNPSHSVLVSKRKVKHDGSVVSEIL